MTSPFLLALSTLDEHGFESRVQTGSGFMVMVSNPAECTNNNPAYRRILCSDYGMWRMRLN
jgi:hypothetical protein